VILPAILAPAVPAISANILVKGTLHMITYTKIQASAAAVVVLLMVGGTGYVGVRHVQALQERGHAEEQASRIGREGGVDSATDADLMTQAQTANQRLREQAREIYRLRDQLTQLRPQAGAVPVSSDRLNLQDAPADLQASAERLRELQYEQFMAAGQKAMTLQPLTQDESNTYAREVNMLKNIGLALRIYATDHGDEFPASIDALLATETLDGGMKEELRSRMQNSKYEYIRFKGAESKPSLPAVWWSAPDDRGVRLVAMNDGSVQTIREPAGVPKPGYVAAVESTKR
jgi:hypothetical protein